MSTMAPTGDILYLIFLDIDGVLLPFPATTQSSDSLFPTTTLQPLQRLVRELSSYTVTVQWILSSTWRMKDSFIRDIEEACQSFFSLQDSTMPTFRFADVTDRNLHSERQWEIHAYLESKRKTHTNIVWLAIDDEELLEGDKNAMHREAFCHHVVQTESAVGLTEANVDTALSLWKRQIDVIGRY